MSARSLLLGPNAETIGNRIDRTGGLTTGFDYLRIGLSVAVLSWHSVGTSHGTAVNSEIMAGPIGGLVRAILPMFFALSGFLVCGSLFRSKSLVVFAMHRALRLVPALAVEILLSAFILGPLLTAWSLSAYFADGEFWTYFLNIVGEIHFRLPGLFLDNPFTGIVNRSLWTIPSELRCYLVLLGVGAIGLVRRRVALTLLIGAGWAGYLAAGYTLGFARHWHEDLYTPGHVLVLSFLVGNLLYIWRDKVRLNRTLLAGSVLASAVALSLPELAIYAPLPVAYVTVYLGLTSPRKVPILMDGDYSYGLYLFAFPIQQSYSHLFPGGRFWWANILVALPASLIYAHFSWTFIEKPVLGHRKRLTALVERALARVRETAAWRRGGAAVPLEPAPTDLV